MILLQITDAALFRLHLGGDSCGGGGGGGSGCGRGGRDGDGHVGGGGREARRRGATTAVVAVHDGGGTTATTVAQVRPGSGVRRGLGGARTLLAFSAVDAGRRRDGGGGSRRRDHDRLGPRRGEDGTGIRGGRAVGQSRRGLVVVLLLFDVVQLLLFGRRRRGGVSRLRLRFVPCRLPVGGRDDRVRGS